jgi:sugar phosphate isomerase/epimerase
LQGSISSISRPGRVGLHLDTFHMHLEKDSAAAIRKASGKIFMSTPRE